LAKLSLNTKPQSIPGGSKVGIWGYNSWSRFTYGNPGHMGQNPFPTKNLTRSALRHSSALTDSMARMNIVGSLCFCSECGSLLDLSSGTSTIKCEQCKAPYSTNGTSLSSFGEISDGRIFNFGNHDEILTKSLPICSSSKAVCN